MRLKAAFAAALFAATTAGMSASAEDLRYCDYGKQLLQRRQHAEAIQYFNHCIQAGQLSAPSMVFYRSFRRTPESNNGLV